MALSRRCDRAQNLSVSVTERVVVTKYFWCMDPSVHFLIGKDDACAEGATIHSIAPEAPVSIDENKIGFTLDVAVRLDQESDDDLPRAEIVPDRRRRTQELADSA